MKGIIRKATLLCCAVAAAGGLGCNTTDSNSGSVRAACPDGGCGGGCGNGCGGDCGGCGSGSVNGYGGHKHKCCDKCGGHDGCDWELWDKCYPQRYEYLAHKGVNAAFAPQVQNGHVLDQTVWAHHFEPGTDKLSPGGREHLAYLARRRPCPDTTVYLQTADDLCYDAACPDEYAAARHDLDIKRVQAIQKFLVAHTAGRPVDFQVLIHDPWDPTIPAIPIGGGVGVPGALPQMWLRFRGGLSNYAGAGSAAGAATGR
jgi:hypothetical protein